MSTSEPDKSSSSLLPKGVLDPEILARMANEFFTALPLTDAAVPSALPVGATESLANSPALASVQNTAVPTEEQLRALPATLPLAHGQPQVPASLGSSATLPGIP